MLPGARAFGWLLVGAALVIAAAVTGPGSAVAVEIGEPAPNFTLPSSMGGDVSLADFHGKKWVLLEFYGADFVPT